MLLTTQFAGGHRPARPRRGYRRPRHRAGDRRPAPGRGGDRSGRLRGRFQDTVPLDPSQAAGCAARPDRHVFRAGRLGHERLVLGDGSCDPCTPRRRGPEAPPVAALPWCGVGVDPNRRSTTPGPRQKRTEDVFDRPARGSLGPSRRPGRPPASIARVEPPVLVHLRLTSGRPGIARTCPNAGAGAAPGPALRADFGLNRSRKNVIIHDSKGAYVLRRRRPRGSAGRAAVVLASRGAGRSLTMTVSHAGRSNGERPHGLVCPGHIPP